MRRGRIGFWYRFAILVIKPLLLAFTKRDWRGAEYIPAEGGVIVAVNHISHLDPFTFAHLFYESGRLPRFLAKAELFTVPFVGRVLRGAKQIPVHRRTADAQLALADAVAALEQGECVTIYPEGTITRDPELWPMLARTGVARLALSTGVPVLPVAQWGTQEILWPYSMRLRLLPRKTVHVAVGPPVDLSAYAGEPLTAEVLRGATDAVTAAIRDLLAEVRGEDPPAEVYDVRRRGDRKPPPPSQRKTDHASVKRSA